MRSRDYDDILVDSTLMRIAETILDISARIERGTIPDTGTVQTLRNLAKSIINSTSDEPLP
jgi:hypothetical protein